MSRFQPSSAKAFLAQFGSTIRERDMWKEAFEKMEACDCIPAEISSRACPKCGRRGVVTDRTMNSIMREAGKTRAALEMLWKHHLLPLSSSQRHQVKEALGIADSVKKDDPCGPCGGTGAINGHRCYACYGTGLRARVVID